MLPELKGKLDGSSIRVPTPNVSLIDFKFVPKRDHDRRGGQQASIKAATAATVRSRAFSPSTTSRWSRSTSTTIPRARPSTSKQTQVIDGKLVRVLSWYDNEWGFSNRMVDTAVAMAKLG